MIKKILAIIATIILIVATIFRPNLIPKLRAFDLQEYDNVMLSGNMEMISGAPEIYNLILSEPTVVVDRNPLSGQIEATWSTRVFDTAIDYYYNNQTAWMMYDYLQGEEGAFTLYLPKLVVGNAPEYHLTFPSGVTSASSIREPKLMLASFSYGYEQGRQFGYTEGYAAALSATSYQIWLEGRVEGKAEGLVEGEAIGFAKGYTDGYDLGFADGYDLGDFEGELIGFERGRSQGDAEGYARGRGQGLVEGEAIGFEKGQNSQLNTNWLISIFSTIDAFLNIRLAFDITIGNILFVPIITSLIIFLVGLFKR